MKISRLLVLAISIGTVVYLSCRRNPDISLQQNFEQRFFTIPGNTQPLVKTLAEKIKQQNQRYGFINSLIKRNGYALWDKSIVIKAQERNFSARNTHQPDTSMVLIPFVKENNIFVNSILGVKMTKSDTLYRLIYAEEYANYTFDDVPDSVWNAKKIFDYFF